MNKEEFLRELQECLAGEVSSEEIQETVSYYKNYIAEEVRKGKTEEEIIKALGSGRLIARSIIDAALDGREEAGHYYGKMEDGEYNEVTYDENNELEHPEIEERKQKIASVFRTILVGLFLVAVLAIFLHLLVPLLLIVALFTVVSMIWKRLQ